MSQRDLHELRDEINDKLPRWLQVFQIEAVPRNEEDEDTNWVIIRASVTVTSVNVADLHILDDFVGDPAELLANDLKLLILRGMGVGELRDGLKEVLDWIESDRLNYAQEVALELLEAFEEGILVEKGEA